MSDDIASNGLFGICSKHGSSIYLCHHLVCDDNSHAKLQEKQPKPNYFPQSEQKSREKDTEALLMSITVGSSLSKPMERWRQSPWDQIVEFCKKTSEFYFGNHIGLVWPGFSSKGAQRWLL